MSALTVVPVTFKQLAGESAAVVYARVADVRGQGERPPGIDSVVTLDDLKGDLGLAVAMRLPGGEGGGLRQMPPGAPSVREGDLVVVFLKARGPALLSPVGLGQACSTSRATRVPG